MTKERKECRRSVSGPPMTSTIALFQCQMLKLCDYRVQMRAGDRAPAKNSSLIWGSEQARPQLNTIRECEQGCTCTHIIDILHFVYYTLPSLWENLSSSLSAPMLWHAHMESEIRKSQQNVYFFFPSLERKFGPDSSVEVDDVRFRMTIYSTLIQWANPHVWDSPLTLRKILKKIIYCHELD